MEKKRLEDEANLPLYKKLSKGDVVKAMFSGDGRYYKASIVSTIQKGYVNCKYDVQFEGYGDVETVSWQDVKEIKVNEINESYGSINSPLSEKLGREEQDQQRADAAVDIKKEVDAFGRDISLRAKSGISAPIHASTFKTLSSSSSSSSQTRDDFSESAIKEEYNCMESLEKKLALVQPSPVPQNENKLAAESFFASFTTDATSSSSCSSSNVLPQVVDSNTIHQPQPFIPSTILSSAQENPLGDVVNPAILKRKAGGWRTKK